MILSCGEALIDMLPRRSSQNEACFAPYAGGAVFNTAIALGRLGRPSAFFSGISRDILGQVLTDTLAASKVDCRYVALSDRPCTLAFVKLVDGQASYAFYDEATAGRMLAYEDLPDLKQSDVHALFFGGISLVMEPAAATYEALAAREAAARVIMIDPNIRPGFIAGREDSYRARITRMIAMADIVKLSDEDLLWLEAGGPSQDLKVLASKVLERGPKAVFITCGADGAFVLTRKSLRQKPGLKVEVADTVGAGDTFNAGVLAALDQLGALTKAAVADLSDDILDACLDLGIKAASVTVSRPGANPPWSHEL